jgi:hypothetical protein
MSTRGDWMYENVASTDLVLNRQLAVGTYYLFPCNSTRASGTFEVRLVDGRKESHSFCHQTNDGSNWAVLIQETVQARLCFYETFNHQIGGDFRVGLAPTNCHLFPFKAA